MNKQSFITILLTVLMSMTGTKTFAHDIAAANNDGVTIYYIWTNNNTELAVSYRGSYPNDYFEYTGNVVIPESVKYSGNTYLVTSIGSYAFSGCSGLTSITIPNSVTSIGILAFRSCSGLTSIKVDIDNQYLDSRNNCNAIIEKTSNKLLVGCKNTFIPSNVTSIGYSAFSGCSGLTSITIPNSVTSIGSSAFERCSSLTSVISEIENPYDIYNDAYNRVFKGIPTNAVLIVPKGTKAAYQGKKGWSSFNIIIDKITETKRTIHVATAGTLPNLISEEEKYQIEELTLTGELNGTDFNLIREMAGNMTYIDEEDIPRLCNKTTGGKLKKLDLSGAEIKNGGNAYYYEEDPHESYYFFNYCTQQNIVTYALFAETELESIILPNSVTEIHERAFASSKLKTITIPPNVTSIGGSAFSGCSGLTSVTIPNSVTSIGNGAFSGCSGLTSVTIPNSVTSIGNGAFVDCSGLTSVTIPNSVTSIGGGAFSGCSGLTSITIPNSVTSIGYSAFENCSSLTSITIPSSVTYIGGSAFNGTAWYNNQPNGLVYVGLLVYTYKGEMPSDTQIKIKEGTIGISGYAFSGCTGLTSVIIPNSMTSIANYAFFNCNSLTSVIIPNSVTFIDYWAFRGCSSLTSVISEIENPFDIDKYAFDGIPANALLIVPKGTKAAYQGKKGWNVFSNIFSGEIGDVFEVNGITYEILENNTVTAKSGKNASGHVTIPNQVSFYGTTYNVTSISSGAFSYCDNIVAITIPNSVTSIGSYAFRNCSNLVSAIIGSGVTSIGSNAFYNTTLAKTIWLTNTLPSGYSTALGTVNYVSNDQFNISNKVVYKFLSSYFEVDGIRYVPVSPSDHTCDAIDCVYDESAENINIGETVTYKNITLTVMNVNPFTCYQNKYIKDANVSLVGKIGKYAFYGCTGLKTAAIKNQGSVGDYAFSSCSAMETAELGQKVTSIGTSSFTCCSKLKSIIIPDAVNSVGSSAFTGCEAMTSAKIGNGFETINEYTFSACSSLKVLEIGSSVKTINKYAFSGCSSLPTITIPKTVTKIDNSVFNSCNSLAKIIIADSENTLTLGSNRKGSYDYGDPLFSSCPLDSVYIGRDISYSISSSYGYSPFYRNTSLRAVKITNKETEISENEFYGCTNLQKVIIGDGVNTIGKWAFSGCQSLKFFAFGTQVANIGQNAFSDCTALIEITSQATTPPECGSQALDDINKWECKLYVPDGCLDAYQNAEQWKEFFYIEEGEGTIVIDDGQGDANDDGKVDKYDIDAIVEYIMTGDLNSINFKNADVNKDGKVNVVDVTMLISIINMNNLSN